MSVLHLDLGADSYDIVIERDSLRKAGEYLDKLLEANRMELPLKFQN